MKILKVVLLCASAVAAATTVRGLDSISHPEEHYDEISFDDFRVTGGSFSSGRGQRRLEASDAVWEETSIVIRVRIQGEEVACNLTRVEDDPSKPIRIFDHSGDITTEDVVTAVAFKSLSCFSGDEAAVLVLDPTAKEIDGLILRGNQTVHFHQNASGKPKAWVENELRDGGCAKARNPPGASRMRRLKSSKVSQWKNCFPKEHIKRKLSVGIAVGEKLLRRMGSSTQTVNWAKTVVAEASLVFEKQMNIELVLGTLYLEGKRGKSEWNSGCSKNIDATLTDFEKWAPPVEEGVWHLFDDCFNGYYLGLASMSTLCWKKHRNGRRYNTAVVYYTEASWLTFAHELGHNLGADHSFEEGMGSTGGIMDYGNGKLAGVFQFNTKYRKSEVCEILRENVDSCQHITKSTSKVAVETSLIQVTAAPTVADPCMSHRRKSVCRRVKNRAKCRWIRGACRSKPLVTCASLRSRTKCTGKKFRKYNCKWDKVAKLCTDKVQDAHGCFDQGSRIRCKRHDPNCRWDAYALCHADSST